MMWVLVREYYFSGKSNPNWLLIAAQVAKNNKGDVLFLKTLADVPTFIRRADVASLLRPGAIGVELGVAEGKFSEALLATSRFSHLYSIDMWAGDRGHNIKQYKSALRRFAPYRGISTTMRMTFDDAIDLFPDEFFDFIYVDGYAHTGEQEGNTFRQWWPKLKQGGIMAGDDYSPKWPLVVKAVDKFIEEYGLEFQILNPKPTDDKWSQFPTWVSFKPAGHVAPLPNPDILSSADAALKEKQWDEAAKLYRSLGDLKKHSKRADILKNILICEINTRPKNSMDIQKAAPIVDAMKAGISAEISTELRATDAVRRVASALAHTGMPWMSLIHSSPASRIDEVLSGGKPILSIEEMGNLVFSTGSRPWEWWAAAYARLLYLGYAESAYAAKHRAALGVLSEGASPSLAVAAAKYIETEASVAIDSGPVLDSDLPFSEMVRGKSISIVGPAVNALKSGPTIDAADVVIRTNFISSPQFFKQSGMLGSRADVSYYNLDQFWRRTGEIISTLQRFPVRSAVLRSNASLKKIKTEAPHIVSRRGPFGSGIFLGRGYALRHLIDDIKRFEPGQLTCYGADFFLSEDTHSEGYVDRSIDIAESYINHDPLDTWTALRQAQSTMDLKADEVLQGILDMPREHFLREIGKRVAPALYS